jgi:hypothetical protein
MRACTRCREVKPLEAFPPVKRGEPKLQSWCRQCFAGYGAEYYRKNREAQKARLLRNVAVRREDNRRRVLDYLRAHPCVDCGESDVVVLEFDHVGEKRGELSQMINSGLTWAVIEREIATCEVRCANCHQRKTGIPDRGRVGKAKPRRLPHGRIAVRPPGLVQMTLPLDLRRCRVCGVELPLDEFNFRSRQKGTRFWICRRCQSAYHRAWWQRVRNGAMKRIRNNSERARVKLRGYVLTYLLEHPCVDCGQTDPLVLQFDHLSDKVANISEMIRRQTPWPRLLAEIRKCAVRCANCHRRRTAAVAGSYRLGAPQGNLTATPERIELSPAVP